MNDLAVARQHPMAPHEIANKLAELGSFLDVAATDLARLDMEAVEADAEAETAEARAFLTADGAMDVRRRKAILECTQVKLTAEIAAAKHRAARRRFTVLERQLDALRSLGTYARAEASLTRTEAHP